MAKLTGVADKRQPHHPAVAVFLPDQGSKSGLKINFICANPMTAVWKLR
jgi:hypothetical protein